MRGAARAAVRPPRLLISSTGTPLSHPPTTLWAAAHAVHNMLGVLCCTGHRSRGLRQAAQAERGRRASPSTAEARQASAGSDKRRADFDHAELFHPPLPHHLHERQTWPTRPSPPRHGPPTSRRRSTPPPPPPPSRAPLPWSTSLRMACQQPSQTTRTRRPRRAPTRTTTTSTSPWARSARARTSTTSRTRTYRLIRISTSSSTCRPTLRRRTRSRRRRRRPDERRATVATPRRAQRRRLQLRRQTTTILMGDSKHGCACPPSSPSLESTAQLEKLTLRSLPLCSPQGRRRRMVHLVHGVRVPELVRCAPELPAPEQPLEPHVRPPSPTSSLAERADLLSSPLTLAASRTSPGSAPSRSPQTCSAPSLPARRSTQATSSTFSSPASSSTPPASLASRSRPSTGKSSSLKVWHAVYVLLPFAVSLESQSVGAAR